MSTDIALVGVNARYRHTSFGLRCLQANLEELEARSILLEFTINERPIDLVEKILAVSPRVVGLGVYIWNVEVVEALVGLLRRVQPDLTIVLGGPEVSYELEGQAVVAEADYVICGEGEQAFTSLCRQLLNGERPSPEIIQGTTPPMEALALPYRLYTDEDLAHRVVYVEASRGCPYRCQFCLSSLDKKVRSVSMEAFFAQMDDLLARGAKDFKFIDRTFNLSMPFSLGILNFFYERMRPGLSLHFEMVPERLPAELLEALARFPAGVVQLEVGVQTFNEEVARRISRPLNTAKISDNLRALHGQTEVHLHVDLIVGLPGETWASFGAGFDRLQALGPHEIQVGILKRLKGTPIRGHSEAFDMVYSPKPPFEVLRTSALSFEELQAMKRLARFWDLLVNNGQFPASSALIWANEASVFDAFHACTTWLYARAGRSSHISLLKLADLLTDFLVEARGMAFEEVAPVVVRDLKRTGGRRVPRRLQPFEKQVEQSRLASLSKGLKRQRRHLQAATGAEKDIV
jgi:radical SAM superfamily enzyme YgiQ (UPF0313 family)